MIKLKQRYLALKTEKTFFLQVFTGFLLLALSVVFSNFANSYTTIHSSSAVSDIILDNVRPINVEFIFLEGYIALIAFVTFLGFYKPVRIPFILNVSALFIFTRSCFITLTHLAPPLHEVIFYSKGFLERLVAGSDAGLFFSGHTGYPFLMALIFWKNKPLRYFFLGASLLFGAAVLFGHLHYSIDVFSAFFISYGIYHIAVWLFKKDHELFQREL